MFLSRTASVLALSTAVVLVVTATARAQGAPAFSGDDEHLHHDEESGHLHFSHPLVTESPSPDTKLRLDYVWTRTGTPADRATERDVRLEGEYAFAPEISLAVTVPYAWRTPAGQPAAHAFENTEVSLKAASLRWGERGLLVGGGMSVGLPTGSDQLGIGTSRAIELEPFLDIGFKRGGLEVVGFGHYSATVHNAAGVSAERELGFNGSVLYPVSRIFEPLLELEATRTTAGAEHTSSSTLAPGLEVFPFSNRSIMAGISALLGLSGEARDTRGVLVSAFYHF